jgi:RNA polymerase-binding protein DksA
VSPSTSSKKAARAPKKPVRAKAAKKPAPRKPSPPVSAPIKPKLKGPYAKKELGLFRQALLALRSHRIGDKESREKEALKAAGQDVSVDHMADFGTDNYEQEFTLGILEQDVETLRDINDALTRIQEGSYGLCEECEKPIAKARLKALPYARLCVDCKTKEE